MRSQKIELRDLEGEKLEFVYTGDTLFNDCFLNPANSFIFQSPILFTELTYLDGDYSKAIEWGHIHMQDIVNNYHLFHNSMIIFGHISTKYPHTFILTQLKKMLPLEIACRVYVNLKPFGNDLELTKLTEIQTAQLEKQVGFGWANPVPGPVHTGAPTGGVGVGLGGVHTTGGGMTGPGMMMPPAAAGAYNPGMNMMPPQGNMNQNNNNNNNQNNKKRPASVSSVTTTTAAMQQSNMSHPSTSYAAAVTQTSFYKQPQPQPGFQPPPQQQEYMGDPNYPYQTPQIPPQLQAPMGSHHSHLQMSVQEASYLEQPPLSQTGYPQQAVSQQAAHYPQQQQQQQYMPPQQQDQRYQQQEQQPLHQQQSYQQHQHQQQQQHQSYTTTAVPSRAASAAVTPTAVTPAPGFIPFPVGKSSISYVPPGGSSAVSAGRAGSGIRTVAGANNNYHTGTGYNSNSNSNANKNGGNKNNIKNNYKR